MDYADFFGAVSKVFCKSLSPFELRSVAVKVTTKFSRQYAAVGAGHESFSSAPYTPFSHQHVLVAASDDEEDEEYWEEEEDEEEWEDDEVNFYLLFRNPLTIIADAWENREPTQDFDDVMYGISDDDGVITQYPLLEGSYADIVYIGEPDDERIRFESEI